MRHAAALVGSMLYGGLYGGLSGGAAGAGHAQVDADFNGDGQLDLVVAHDATIEIHLGNASRVMDVIAPAPAAADVDCNGRLDLILDSNGAWLSNEVLIAKDVDAVEGGAAGAPAGAFAYDPVWDSQDTLLENSTRHIIADFDGDGRNELVTADYNGPFGKDIATLRVFEGVGDNQWQPTWSYSDGPRIFSGMAAVDIDEDGVIELLAGKIGGTYGGTPYVGPRVYIFQSDGDGGFVLEDIIEVDPAVSAFTYLDDLAVGDADGDGRLDIAVGVADNETALTQTYGSKIRVFTRDPRTGAYELILSHVQSNVGIGYVTAIDIGDSDNDGQPEVLYFERVAVTVRRFEHNGVAFVLKAASTGIAAGVCMDAMIADPDQDGIDEIICGGQSNGSGHLYLIRAIANDAFGLSFTDAEGIGNTVLYVAMDGSEHPPLVAASAHSSQVLVMAHVGAGAGGAYETLAFFAVPAAEQLQEISIGRFDGDCSRDLMITQFRGTGDSGLYEHREVAATMGDVDCSGVVDAADLAQLLGAWSLPPGTPGCAAAANCPADLNGDNFVNAADLAIFLGAWTF